MNDNIHITTEQCTALAASLLDELSSVVLGKRQESKLLFAALIAGGHVIIEDIPGVGKTTLANALARASGLDFGRVQFTPDVTASDITGYNMFSRKTNEFEFRPGAVMCNILLADEINRASPKTQSSLLEAMSEGCVTVDGVTYSLPKPFMVIATQNPLGFVGTYPLPEAQLDRFALRLSMGYPAKQEELEIAKGSYHEKTLAAVTKRADARIITQMRSIADDVYCADSVYEYIVDVVAATRTSQLLALGASPRASIMLVKLAKASAFLEGRNYVLPSDVTALILPVLSHRVVLSREALAAGRVTDEVIDDIKSKIRVPVLSKRGPFVK